MLDILLFGLLWGFGVTFGGAAGLLAFVEVWGFFDRVWEWVTR